jgi:hypothetical protein
MRVKGTVVCALCVVLASCAARTNGHGGGGGYRIRPTKQERRVLVVLTQRGNNCAAVYSDARAYEQEKVVFEVNNQCEGTHSVRLEFGAATPFQEGASLSSKPIPEGGKDTINVTVRDHPDSDFPNSRPKDYRYDILLDDKMQEDPKFEVDPWS